MFPKITGVFGKPRLFPVRCSKIRLLSNSKSRNDIYLASGIAPKAIIRLCKISSNGKGCWILFKIRIFTQDGALTQQLLYIN